MTEVSADLEARLVDLQSQITANERFYQQQLSNDRRAAEVALKALSDKLAAETAKVQAATTANTPA